MMDRRKMTHDGPSDQGSVNSDAPPHTAPPTFPPPGSCQASRALLSRPISWGRETPFLMRRPSLLYRLSVHVAARTAGLAARSDKKLARGLDGRRGLGARLAAWAAAHRDPRRPLVWMHAPSVGEGLQAKPVLETLRAEHPEWQLAFTFFSPSAERLAKNLPVDVADYLPLDRPADVEAVLDALRPAALVFSKLDVWPELTLAAAHRGVKLGLISATVAPHSSRLRWPTRQWSHGAYQALDRI